MVDSWTTPGHSGGLADLLLRVSRRWCENDDDHDEPLRLRATALQYIFKSHHTAVLIC